MRKLIISVMLWLHLTGLLLSQNNRSTVMFGAEGLATTEETLDELDLPSWLWGGAHVFENVAQNYRLVDGGLLDNFFSKHTIKKINDPQHILNDKQHEKIKELIAAHDMKSAIPLYVNMLVHGQKLSLTESELKLRLGKIFEDHNAIVIFYFYGYARGSKGHLLMDGKGFIENWEVDELFLKSARDASVQLEYFSEMESFIKNVSKRSYWLEQKLIPSVVAEKSKNQVDQEKKKTIDWNGWLWILTNHTLTLVLVFWVLAAGGWYFLWSRKWRKFVIHNGDVPVRLGADHGANVSSPIEFSDSKISLREQQQKAKSREL